MVVSHQAEGREEPYQAAVGKVASYLEEGENLEGQGNQGAEAQEACQAYLGVGAGREVLLGKRPEAVGCQGRRGAHLWEPLAQEELKPEGPLLVERHMSAEWLHTQHSDLYRWVQVRGSHALP